MSGTVLKFNGVTVSVTRFFPEDEQWLAEAIKRWAFIIPPYMRIVQFKYVEDGFENKRTIAQTTIDYEYRQSTVEVCSLGFEKEITPYHKEMWVLHELLHIAVSPLAEYARKELERLIGEEAPRYNSSVKEQLIGRVEMVVQDIAGNLIEHHKETDNA